jgi:hypothetical protein
MVAAVVVLTVTVVAATLRLQHQADLSSWIRVDWATWWFAVVLAYLGLGLIGRWALARDNRRAGDRSAAR